MKIESTILNVLSNARAEENKLYLTGELDRNIYLKTNKVLEAAGAKWNKKIKAHLFESDAQERIDQIILTGEITIPKDDFEFFPTPPELAKKVIDIAEIKSGMSVLEPSAGIGALAKEAAAVDGVSLSMYELNPEHNRHLKSLNIGFVHEACDFLKSVPVESFDRVIMNPPFGKQADIKHVTHALKFLKPNGILIAIMSSSITFRTNKLTLEFLELLKSRNHEIISLPEKSFSSSGTNVNTVILKVIN